MTWRGPSQRAQAVVEAFDTNVVVRLLVRDDEVQCQRAERALQQAVAAGGAWISSVVMVETSWVLRVAYKFDRATIAAALRRLQSSEDIHLEDEPAVLRALSQFEIGPADFADYFILDAARVARALPLHTFDERLARADGAMRVQ
ncbi:MAG TPA: type II toxin-antitoxin system VapC family toxin [Polyangiaceae bacterium]|nr:type II toxin-antitoxin system VapC family toxin [Polyangiaceae bacterium]